MKKRKILYSAGALFSIFLLSTMFQNCAQNLQGLSAKNSNSSQGVSDPSTPSRPPVIPTPPNLGSPCTRDGYNGWNCWQTTVVSQENITYQIELRWNRINKSSVGTVISAVGGNGTGASRENTSIPGIRKFMDELDQLDQIRMVEIDFLDPSNNGVKAGGYFKSPTGYYAAASAFLASVELIFAKGLADGTFVNYFGGSNATMVAAYAMSHFGADRFFDRVLFQIGPFIPNLQHACDPNHWASFHRSPAQYGFIKELVNSWSTGDQNTDVCTKMNPDRVSIAKTSRVRFPKTAVHVVVGLDEVTQGFGPWILESNLEWYENVEAPEKTRVGIPGLGHSVDWDQTRIYLNKRPPAAMGANPTLKLTLSQGGSAQSQFPLGKTLYGEVGNLGNEDVISCIALEGSKDCDNPHNWTAMPANGWSYNTSTKLWGTTGYFIDPANLKAGQRFSTFWQNRKTGQRTPAETLEIIPATTLTSFVEPVGKFCSPTKTLTFFSCKNGNPGDDWRDQGGGCYHYATNTPCSP